MPRADTAVRESNIKGVTEICPSNASMQVRFDPDQIAPDDLLAEVRSLEAAATKRVRARYPDHRDPCLLQRSLDS